MANQVAKKFCWVIKDFTSLRSEWCFSVPVMIGDVKWRLVAIPKGVRTKPGYLALGLQVVSERLPCGWRGYSKYCLTIVNQHYDNLSVYKEGCHWFEKGSCWGFAEMIPLINLHAINSGFLVNGELVIIAEVEVLEVIGTHLLNASQLEEISDQQIAHESSSSSSDDVTVEVNGFQVLKSQVNQVKVIFEKHPDLTSNFSLKNQQLKNAYMDVLLDLMKTLSKPAKELNEEDLNKVDNTISDLTKAGFKLDWLRQMFDEALEKQIAWDTRIRELERQVKKRKLALTQLETDLEKEKSAASARFIDVV